MGRCASYLILAGFLLSAAGCRNSDAPQSSSAAEPVAQPALASTADTPRTPQHDPPTPADDHRPVVACFGDSLTAGHGADLGSSYPDYLQKDLKHDGFNVRVVNLGVSGNTSKDGVDRLPQVLALKPQIVVVEFGGNDGLRGLKVETTRQNLATMIEALKAAHSKVVIAGITLPPDYGPDYISRFTANYASLGQQYHLPVLPFLLKNVYGVPGMMQSDETHATNAGNEVVARNVLPYVEKLLKK